MNGPLRVVCLAGPTGAGKTAAAIGLAAALDGEIVNADSRQAYRDFPLITAQPAEEERRACPHHLYGFLDVGEKLSAGRWAHMALTVARDIARRGKTPLLVGGTGLYFRALLDGIVHIPPVDPAVSARWLARCAAEGPETLHAELAAVDPIYAKRIHPHDRQRIVRALEVWEDTGRSFSWWHAHAAPAPLCVGVRLGLDISLAELAPRLEARMEAMLAAGALEEARAAFALCADARAPGWSGIGCAELYRCLEGELNLAEARTLWLRHTRAYAKRQLTWFRAEGRMRWTPHGPEDPLPALLREALDFLRGRGRCFRA